MSTDDPGIIPLSHWRAQVARARKTRRIDALLEERDAEKLVPQLPIEELFYTIKEVGLHDAEDLLALTSPEQVQGFLDLDVWQREHFDEARAVQWFDALVSAGPVKFASVIDALDGEEVALYLQRQAKVYDLSIDTLPEEPEGHFYPTPDRFFMLDILVEGERGKSLERQLDWLYRADLEMARRVVMSARWEMPSDLEEWAYRWRSGRMADRGFVDYYSALSIYQPLDAASIKLEPPVSLPAEASVPLPVQLTLSLDDTTFFVRTLTCISNDAELDRLQMSLLLLTNRALSAEPAEPGDLALSRSVLKKNVATLSLGLETLSRGDLTVATELLAKLTLEKIFRIGFTLTLQLQRLCKTLLTQGQVRLPNTPALLLDAPYDALCRSLAEKRPQFALELDGKAAGSRPFQSLADIARAAQALEEAALIGPLLFSLVDQSGVAAKIADCALVPSQVRFGTLIRTMAANFLLERDLVVEPIEASATGELAKRLSRLSDFEATLRGRIAEKNLAAPPFLHDCVEHWLQDFSAQLSRPDGLLIKLVRSRN